MVAIQINSIFYEIKNSYKGLLAILGFALISYTSLLFSIPFDSFLVSDTFFVFLPLGVFVASFILSRLYGNSQVFGRSYLYLSIGYLSIFVGEFIFWYYLVILEIEFIPAFDLLFLPSYPLIISHLIINIRYFATKLENHQKAALFLVPLLTTLTYLHFVSDYDTDVFFFYQNLLYVILSSTILGLVVVGFTLFRNSVMFVAWFLFLIGLFIDTVGTVYYYHGYTIDLDLNNNPFSILWSMSYLIMIYALYKHQKSI